VNLAIYERYSSDLCSAIFLFLLLRVGILFCPYLLSLTPAAGAAEMRSILAVPLADFVM